MNIAERSKQLADFNEYPRVVGTGPFALDKYIKFYEAGDAQEVIAYANKKITDLHLEGQGSFFPTGTYVVSELASPHLRSYEEFRDLDLAAKGLPTVNRVNILDFHPIIED